MGFIKKILVLKEGAKGFSLSGKPLTGIVRIEIEDLCGKVYLSTLNMSAVSEGEFTLCIVDENQDFFAFPLGTNPYNFTAEFARLPKIDKGFATAVVYVNCDKVLVVGLSISSTLEINEQVLTDIIYEKINKTQNGEKSKNEKSDFSHETEYDDEVVATENYFLNEPTHDGYTIIKEEIYNECDLSKKDANLKKSCEREKTAEKNKDEGLFDGTHFDRIGALDETFYFDQVRDEINNLFATFPEEKCLIKALPGSKFVRVKYSASKFYVVGVVYENQKPKYICYGVPGKYSPEPPNELKGYASFLPLSIFDLKGDGYWMLYQDAVTGDCVRINF